MTELSVNIKATSLRKKKMRTQNTRPMALDVATETITANFAPFPFPAPSSFATLTHVAAKNARCIIISHPLTFMQMERESTAIRGSFKFPVKSTNTL
eukprot:Gb_13399 [translate_table: standard]